MRDAAAAFSAAARTHARLAVRLPESAELSPDVASAAIVEGIVLARYSYDPLKSARGGPELERVTVLAGDTDTDAARRGAQESAVLANATQLARDLANAPPGHLTATDIADLAAALGPERGLEVQVVDEHGLAELACGGLLGVNAGSAQPPRMVKLSYVPRTPEGEPAEPSGRLTLVGKGVMYDSGEISLKPSDAIHATMR
jgi:leucyl aminopeptidase